MAAVGQDVKFNWAEPLLSSDGRVRPTDGTSVVYDVQLTKNNELITLGSFGSTFNDPVAEGDVTTYFGREFYGAPYDGNSQGSNMVITKSDSTGRENLQWLVYSNGGDVSVSATKIAPTSDGGVFFIADSRHASQNFKNDDVVLRLVGNDGESKEIVHRIPDEEWADGLYHWSHYGVYGKISKSGSIEWMRMILVDNAPMPDAGHYSYGTTSGVKFYGAAQDDEGNFYLAGRQSRDLTFDDETTLVSHNTSGWDGDPQEVRGNSFIVKVDEDGNFVDAIQSEAPDGEFAYVDVKNLEFFDGLLYMTGNVKGGDDVKRMVLGDHSIVPNKNQSIILAALDTDLNTKWLNWVPINLYKNKGYQQQHGITLTQNSIYLTMGLCGGLASPDDPTTNLISQTNTFLNGAMIKCDIKTGLLKDQAVVNSTMIGGAFKAVLSADSVYLFNYNWDAGLKPWAIRLNAFGRESFEEGTSYPLVNSLAMPTAWAAAGVGEKIYFAVRGRNGMTFFDDDETYPYKKFVGYTLSYTFPGRNFSPVENPPVSIDPFAPAANFVAYGAFGGVVVECEAPTQVVITSMTGVIQYNGVVEGQEHIALPAGIYVINNQKVVVY